MEHINARIKIKVLRNLLFLLAFFFGYPLSIRAVAASTGSATVKNPTWNFPRLTFAGCNLISPLSCEQISVDLPVNLTFDNSRNNTLPDGSGRGTGFTIANVYSGTRLSQDGAPSDATVPGYESSRLNLRNGHLQLVTNKGTSFLTNNNQLNALGVQFDARQRYQIETVIIRPENGRQGEEAGIWLGQNDKTYLKVAIVANQIEFRKEVNDVSGTADLRTTQTIRNLDNRTVNLRLLVDPLTNTAEAFYSINGGSTYINIGQQYPTKGLSTAQMSLSTSSVFAGIFATHRNASSPLTYTFEEFNVSAEGGEPQPVTGCEPISTLACDSLQVNLPFNQTFNQAIGGSLTDKNNQGTGLTIVENYSGTRQSADGVPSFTSIPGYEPSQLTLQNGQLSIVSNKGSSYLDNNNQLNKIGVRFSSTDPYQVAAVLINPFSGSQGERAGIWIGQNDKSYLELVVVGNQVEFRRELNDVSDVSDTRITGVISGLNTQIVNLRIVINPTTASAQAFYSTDGTNYINVGAAYSVSGLSLSGLNVTGSTTYAGLVASHRNSSTPVTYQFDNFAIGSPQPDPVPLGCSPISTLPCADVEVGFPFSLNFNQAVSSTMVDKNNQGLGLTLVNSYSGTRLAADGPSSNVNVPGYEVSKLTLGNGRLQILSNKGTSDLTGNNQLNEIGVKFTSPTRYQVETTLINPYNGTFEEQGGLWIGQNDKTFLKLVAVGNKLEFRKEINDISGTSDARITGVISGLNSQTLRLRIIIDATSNSAQAYFSTDGVNFTNVGASYPTAALNITGMNLAGGPVNAGIFASHKNSSTPVIYSFDSFNIGTAAAEPDPTPVACSPISTLPCSEVQVTLPFSLTFSSAVLNTITDQNNLGTGFTMVDAYTGTRLSADGTPSNSSVPGYEAAKLSLSSGRLLVVSNKGISYLSNNNQINSLGVKFSSQTKYQVETRLINPFYGTSAQQAGIWIGQNDKTFLKLVVVGNKLEFRREINDVSGTNDMKETGVIDGLNLQTVTLRIVIDPATNTAEAFYSVNGTSFVNVGAGYSTSGLSIAGMNLTGTTTNAGISATHRNSSTPVTYTFDSFDIGAPATVPDPTPIACSPISTLPCENIELPLPVNLTFNQAVINTIVDQNNQGTGFTLVDAYSGSRLAEDGTPSNSSVPGYEASKLTLGSGHLQVITNKGISYLSNNNQINSLGVKFNSQSRFQVEATLINPFNGTSAQQGGIWIGQNDRSFLKLVAVGNKIEFRKEFNDVSGTDDVKVTGLISGLNTLTVRLRIIVDPATNIAEAFYSTDGINFINVGAAYSSSGLSVSGMSLTGTTTNAGIYVTHRSSSIPVTYTFDNFSVGASSSNPDPTPLACSPISTLPCTGVQVNLPLSLTFNQAISNSISDRNNLGTGFTMVDAYSGSRLSEDGTSTNSTVPGYEASKLTLGNGRLEIVSNKGISYLTNNNQINSLGVKFDSRNRYQVETVLINPFNGSSAQQAGIWIGQNDKTFLKLVAVGNKIEFRKEVNDVSGTNDVRVTNEVVGLNTQTVNLRVIVDPATNIAEAFYSTDGVNFINVGFTYPVSGLSVANMNLTGSSTYAGISATHRNSATPETYTFDNFSITLPVSNADNKLVFNPGSLTFTVLRGGTVRSQSAVLSAGSGSPSVIFTKTDADWFNIPAASLGTIILGNNNLNSDLQPGTYTATLLASASGYETASLVINLTVVEPVAAREVLINFQDSKTIPPPGAFMDYGQAYGLRTGQYQDLNKTYGWKRRTDGTPLDLSKNGRNRLVPDDVLLATLVHMQADDISGSFSGTKIEGYWEYQTMNGDYDVTVSVGDANVGADTESHTINAEGVNLISAFVPSGANGSLSRFKTVTKKVTVSDGTLTINADGGINTKINSVKFVPVSSYVFWALSTQNLLMLTNNSTTETFSVGIGNSTDAAINYTISAAYGAGSSGWLSFNATHSSSEPNVLFNYTAAQSLPEGIYSATVTASAAGFNSKSFTIQLRVVDPSKPYVISSSPANGTTKVSVNTVSVAANKLSVPAVEGYKGGVDNSTITNTTVKLFKIQDNTSIDIAGVVQGTGGGDVISFSPSFALDPFSVYKFMITSGVKSYSGAAFAPFESTFVTGAPPTDSTNILNVKFIKVPVPGTQNKSYSSLAIGPDDKFYALRLDGIIEIFNINHADGSLTLLKSVQTLVNKYGERSAVGITFDPSSTATNVKVWISHCSSGLTAAPEFDGNISLLTGPNLENEQLVITKLPRSSRDHLVNSLTFGPDGALYFNQGSNSSMGDYDGLWQRDETLLSAAVLRIDMQKLAGIPLPLNVQTTANQSVINNAPANSRLMSDGTYNPYSSVSPLTIYGSGVRNAYDLIWHSNGQLYVPTNGSGGGGNSPASILGARRPNGTFYGGPDIPATKNVQVQPDHLFRINPLKNTGYFGHPNPKRGQFVPFRGYLDNPLYPVTIGPDIEYRGTSFDFGLNISANGVIEYKNNAFGGRLKGKLIVCRFSGGGDLIVLEPGSMIKDPNINSPNDDDRIYNIVRAAAGSGNHGMVGMSAFVNPLDLTEDVQTGNLYVIEFNWNGDPSLTSQITLLKVDEAAPAASLNTLASRTLEYKDRDLQTIDEEPSLKVYPNPTTDNQINVVLGNYEPQEKIDLEIYDMLGRLQKKSALVTDGSGSMHSQILLTNFPSDQYYIMKVSSARGSKLVKFFVR